MRTFKISHLSDLHLTTDPNGKRFEPKWSGQLSGMNDAFRHVLASGPVQNSDLVLVTGDLTDRGDLKTWTHFVRMVAGAGLKSRTLAIIGNHDVCGLNARLGWPKRLSKIDLERACNGLMLAGQPYDYPWAKVVDPRVVVFGLDTNNSGNLSPIDNAVGRIGTHQLQRFSELLARHRDVPVKIATMHHSPNIPEPATAIRRGQAPMPLIFRWTHQIPPEDRRAFRNLCIASKVRLVVHGHLHQAEDRRVNGLRIIGAPATTEPIDLKAKAKRYRFYQYTVHANGGRVTVDLVTV